MSALLTIGEFSRATYLSVKTLHHYHEVGLLLPADVDPSSGYRRYAVAQVPIAQVIRRFRELGMPLDGVRAVLEAPDTETRDKVITAHLQHMEQVLDRAQATVASLKAQLEGKGTTLPVEHRSVASTLALAIGGAVDWGDTPGWLAAAFDELHQVLAPLPHLRSGVDAALFSPELYEAHRGQVVAFIPVTSAPRLGGRARLLDVPAADLAVVVHHGPFDEIVEAYGALGTFVAERGIGAEGPIREHYLVTDADTDDPAALRTEVAWPIRARPAEG